MERVDVMGHLSRFETPREQVIYLKRMYENGIRLGSLTYKTRKSIYDVLVDRQVANWRSINFRQGRNE